MCCINYLLNKNRFIFSAILFLILTLFASLSFANNAVVVTGYHDTLWTSQNSRFAFWIENDVVLDGMLLGFEISSPDGVYWEWVPEPNGYGSAQTLRVVPGCRLYPPEEVFGMPGLLIQERDFDGISPDSIIFGGNSYQSPGIAPGPLEKMATITIAPWGPTEDQIKTICIDSASFPQGGDFVFVENGVLITPEVSASLCLPVKQGCCIPPTFITCPTDLIIVDHCQQGTAVVEAIDDTPLPLPITYSIGHTGNGSAGIIDNPDGTATIFYNPLHTEVGTTVWFNVYAFAGPIRIDLPCEVAFYIDGSPPTIDAGASFSGVGVNNTFTKSDIATDDPDLCDLSILSHLIISGPGDIDPSSGVYNWSPGPGDIGPHDIVVGVTDDVDTAQGSFQLNVVDIEMWAGNANCDDNVNLADASFIVNYIFFEGMYPPIPNWADANGDCTINLADAGYLINYIFRDGDDPQAGCVEFY